SYAGTRSTRQRRTNQRLPTPARARRERLTAAYGSAAALPPRKPRDRACLRLKLRWRDRRRQADVEVSSERRPYLRPCAPLEKCSATVVVRTDDRWRCLALGRVPNTSRRQ